MLFLEMYKKSLLENLTRSNPVKTQSSRNWTGVKTLHGPIFLVKVRSDRPGENSYFIFNY